MPGRNIHSEPFSEETITKLEIFESYASEWLPTFIQSGAKQLLIFDFFAGTGYDTIGVPGSTIRILEEIKKQIKTILQKGTKIHFIVNEFDRTKFKSLKDSCSAYLLNNPDIEKAGVKLEYYNKDFAILYDEIESIIGMYPSLVYLDQNGVKFTADKYFWGIAQKPTTDFIYFISSSYIKRFGSKDEFKNVLNVSPEAINSRPGKFIHQIVLEYLRSRIPSGSNVHLYSFTIKKHSNYYGIIFGAGHIRGVDKFLKTAWSMNQINGSANFDIDDDVEKAQGVLFFDQPLTKIESFQMKLREKILSQEISTNVEAFIYTLNEGHIGNHAMEVIKTMKKEGLIAYDARSPKVNYEAAIKDNEIVHYTLVSHEQH